MALVIADRVRETSTTTGTGNFTLGGAVSGFESFLSAVGEGNTCYYTISGGTEWEVGLGTITSGQLVRTTVYKSSNADAAVNFSAGTKDVFVTYPGDKAVFKDASGNVNALGTITSGVWNGTEVTVPYGGTGAASFTAGALLKGNGQSAIAEAVAGTDYVTPSGTETLTNKTLTAPAISGAILNDGYTEEIFALSTSGSIALNPANGSIQTCALTGAPTFTDSLSAGQSIVLMLTNGASYSVTWPTITWVTSAGNAAPTLTAADTLVFWKVSTTLYGAVVGSYA